MANLSNCALKCCIITRTLTNPEHQRYIYEVVTDATGTSFELEFQCTVEILAYCIFSNIKDVIRSACARTEDILKVR